MNLINTAITDFEEVFEKFPDIAECYYLYGQVMYKYKYKV
jgi:hypothetical protein